MSFKNGFDGDVLSLHYIQPTIEAKSIWIPGLTTAWDVSVDSETAYYYTSDTLEVSDGFAGRKLNLAESGAKRHSFDMHDSYGIGGVIPMVNKDTITEDVVGRKLVDTTKAIVSYDNKKGLDAILTTAGTTYTAKTYAKGSTAYGAVVDATATFNKDNKVVFTAAVGNGQDGTQYEVAPTAGAKAKGGWKATTIIVGPTFYAKLQKDEGFIRGNANYSLNEAVIGRVAGLDVVYSTELDETKAEFIIMAPTGFIAPKGVSATEVVTEVEGRPGATLVQAEMVYGFKVLDPKQIEAFTEAKA